VALPPRLEKEIEELRAERQVDVVEDGDWISVIIPAFALGEGYTQSSSDLLIRTQRIYPDAGPDMFWLDVGVLLTDGRPPQAAESIELYQGDETGVVSRGTDNAGSHRLIICMDT
jgi:hypothetical protein